jgi:hypothetical protein
MFYNIMYVFYHFYLVNQLNFKRLNQLKLCGFAVRFAQRRQH